jgi:peroxiredoxin
MVNFTKRGSFSSKLETAANIATLSTAILISFVVVRTYFLSAPLRTAAPIRATESVNVGASLKSRLPGVNWGKNGQTLVLALSTQCHFCTESAPFFRQLSEKPGKAFKIVAVLPQSATEAQEYLKRQGIHVDQLSQMPLEKVGVAGTPTMLLIDQSGIVRKSWVGKLNAQQQGEALKAISAAS